MLCLLLVLMVQDVTPKQRVRDLGIQIGVMQPGPLNGITDVKGVRVGQVNVISGDRIRTGVTVILPHEGDVFQEKVPAAIYLGNGFGKLMGYSQVKELGNLETPIALTNTLSVPTVANALISYTLAAKANQSVRSVNPVVGETNDGRLNDIRGRHVTEAHVLEAIRNASDGPVKEGNVGAGMGTVCFGFKGGIGTSSRRLPKEIGGYTIGVLVQSNFGGALTIGGAPVGKELGKYYFVDQLNQTADGSCMIVVATDAPLTARNLERLAKRALLGLGRTGGIVSNGSGDYVIAFSTDDSLRIPYRMESLQRDIKVLRNEAMSPLFMGVIEATEEAILNSLFAAETMNSNGFTVEALPMDQVGDILKRHGVIK